MFKLFQKKEKEQTLTIDAQIYNDVYSAQDKLIEETERILALPVDLNSERFKRLSKLRNLGFGNAEEVAEAMTLKRKIEQNQEMREKIAYYNQTYPFNKFISKEAVETICKKYNLILAHSYDYIAEIPEENQKAIINFRIKANDIDHSSDRTMYIHYPPQRDKSESLLEGCYLQVIAPVHKLDTRGKEIVGHKLKIKDPIVLQPVHSGYLIVTSWGLEASDPLVVNQVMN